MGFFQILLISMSLLFGWIFYIGLVSPLRGIPWAHISVIVFLCLGFLAILSRIFLRLSIFKEDTHLNESLEGWTFYFMGFFSLLLLSLLFREITWVGLWLAKKQPELAHGPGSVAAVFVLAFALTALGYWNAKTGPAIAENSVPTPAHLDPAFKMKIVQVSDLHISSQIGADYVAKVVEKINALNPDLIVFTGDIGDGTPSVHIPQAEGLKNLRARYGVFYVNGNHEYYRGEKEWTEAFRALGFKILKNSNEVIQVENTPVTIVGTTDFEPQLNAALAGAPENSYKILLTHRPDLADQASQSGIHLQFAGHTHQGQFIPWSWIIGFFHKYPYGLYTIGDMRLYVTSGTGYWGPALRLGSQSEISVVDVTRR